MATSDARTEISTAALKDLMGKASDRASEIERVRAANAAEVERFRAEIINRGIEQRTRKETFLQDARLWNRVSRKSRERARQKPRARRQA